MARTVATPILWALAVLAGGLFCINILLALEMPWWVALVAVIALCGLVLVADLAFQTWRKVHSQRFIGRIMAQQRGAFSAQGEDDRTVQAERNARFLAAMELLKKTDPRPGKYVLERPWIMVLGATGVGKTTAVSQAQFPATTIMGFTGTRHCDWRIGRRAIILDTAGLHTIPIDEGRDRQEWGTFLKLLASYRRSRPLDAVIVAVDVNRLVKTRADELEDDGRQFAQRLEALGHMLGRAFPVYLMVTKCDLIPGMHQFCAALDETQLWQALGQTYRGRDGDIHQFTSRAMANLRERLQRQVLMILHRQGGIGLDTTLLFLPSEFARLESGLQAFAGGVMGAADPRVRPSFRGLYFVSARQTGDTLATPRKAMGREQVAQPATEQRLFLDDLFNRILPGKLPPQSGPLAVFLDRALPVWTAVCLTLGVILGGFGLADVLSLRALDHQVSLPRHMGSDLRADLKAMEGYAEAIVDLRASSGSSWISTLCHPGKDRVADAFEKDLCRRFDQELLPAYDRALVTEIRTCKPEDPRFASYLLYLAERISQLRSLGRAPSSIVLDAGAHADEARSFQRLYYVRMNWGIDQAGLQVELARLQELLRQTLARGGDLHGLVNWVNHDPTLKPLTPSVFWGKGVTDQPGGASIAPCFTRTGQRRINKFFSTIRASLPDPGPVAVHQTAFLGWYYAAYTEAWHTFGLGFSNGWERMEDTQTWRDLTVRVARPDGPYFALLSRMQAELGPVAQGQAVPDWMRLLDEVAGHRKSARLQHYETALAQVATTVAASRTSAFQEVSAAYRGDQRCAFLAASESYRQLQAASAVPGDQFWNLIAGPLDFLWMYANREAAQELQSIWKQRILDTTGVVTDQARLQERLFAPGGIIANFIGGPAAPFLKRDRSGNYSARVFMGRSIGFEPAFLAFLSRKPEKAQSGPLAVSPSELKVEVEGQPTEANDGARVQPHSTRLAIRCDGKEQGLLNMNYPIAKIFTWTSACTGVTLTIAVGNLSLSKAYGGPAAMTTFMRDFPQGEHTFTPRDFPGQAQSLKDLGITAITVRYHIVPRGQSLSVVKQRRDVSIGIPSIIVQ